ncbi:MAG: cyclic pyranopterin monophosphate synthase MoaC [Acidobacteria bacterium]|nr:MAG: cyclic pyranopterin monophosphate synthase MoaC [Acidobacteriota bacterium]
MNKLSHYDDAGNVRMVDVSEKLATAREATASALVRISQATLDIIREGANPKGDPFEIARIAGVQAAKRTSELIPLCHQIPLSNIDIEIEPGKEQISIRATAKTISQTGVEMEALTAVSVAALTIYDMLKAVQKDIVITEVRLESKTGGKTEYHRE